MRFCGKCCTGSISPEHGPPPTRGRGRGEPMKKAFDQNVSRTKPRLKLGGPTPDPVVQETRGAEEEWVYEVAAQVAGHPEIAEAELPTAREVLAAAAQEAEVEEATTRSRVEATLREAEPVREEEHVTVAVGARARGATAASASAPIVSGPAPSARRAEPPPSAGEGAGPPRVSAPRCGAEPRARPRGAGPRCRACPGGAPGRGTRADRDRRPARAGRRPGCSCRASGAGGARRHRSPAGASAR